MPITDIARPADQLVTATPTTPIREIARYMQEQAVGSVIVVDGGDEPTGIVTDRDLALKVINRGLAFDDPVKEVMTRGVATLDGDADVAAACKRMKRERVRRLPIVRDGSLVGLVTADDLLIRLGNELECIADVVEYETRPY